MAGVGGDPRNARYFSVPKQEAMYELRYTHTQQHHIILSISHILHYARVRSVKATTTDTT